MAGAVCAGVAGALTGCSAEDPDAGTNGIGKLSARTIESRARSAAESADAVRLSGKVVSKGRTYRLDMRLKRKGGIGEVSTADTTFALLRVGEELYLKADERFWRQQENDRGPDAAGTGAEDAGGGSEETDEQADEQADEDARAAAAKLEGKYVKVPPADPAYAQLTGFTTMDTMLDGLLSLQGKRETGERGEVGGTRTIQVTAGGGRGGRMDVSLIGAPFPMRLERAGGAGTLHLKDWNKEFELQPPKEEQVVDYGKQIVTDG